MLRSLSEQDGFTLIELVTVIVCVMILAAIAVPRVSAFNVNVEAAQCKSNQSSIEVTCTLHTVDQGSIEYFPSDLSLLYPNYINVIPECPTGGPYIEYNSSTGLVSCSEFGHQR